MKVSDRRWHIAKTYISDDYPWSIIYNTDNDSVQVFKTWSEALEEVNRMLSEEHLHFDIVKYWASAWDWDLGWVVKLGGMK